MEVVSFITKKKQQIKSMGVFLAAKPGCRKALTLHSVHVLRVATIPPVLESETCSAESRDEKSQLLPEDVHGPSGNDGNKFSFT